MKWCMGTPCKTKSLYIARARPWLLRIFANLSRRSAVHRRRLRRRRRRPVMDGFDWTQTEAECRRRQPQSSDSQARGARSDLIQQWRRSWTNKSPESMGGQTSSRELGVADIGCGRRKRATRRRGMKSGARVRRNLHAIKSIFHAVGRKRTPSFHPSRPPAETHTMVCCAKPSERTA